MQYYSCDAHAVGVHGYSLVPSKHAENDSLPNDTLLGN